MDSVECVESVDSAKSAESVKSKHVDRVSLCEVGAIF